MSPSVNKIDKIKKRDGSIEAFDLGRISQAVNKALREVGEADHEKLAQALADRVYGILAERFVGKLLSVEDVQDVVEKVLSAEGHYEAAKAYIIYRQLHAELRASKAVLGVKDDLKLSVNAIKVLERRYLIKDQNGQVIETPRQMFARVAHAVAQGDLAHEGEAAAKRSENEFFRMMSDLDFLPNSPTLMNAGTQIGQLSACFVLPVGDSMEEIFEAVKNMALIHQSGGGTGFSFSSLRPKNDVVQSTGGVASGPVSFMGVFDAATEVIKQGGRRRGANMGVLRVDHPDILEFVTCKLKGDQFRNFNISVGVTDEFMACVENDQSYPLVNPRTKKVTKRLRARDVFEMIVNAAWMCGDPGLLFLDEINRWNQTPNLGQIEATNPCGEQPLLPYEACNLGSINLSRMVENGQVNWTRLGETVEKAVHFLDNVIDVSNFPLPQVTAMTRANRKIGLGVMGFADFLIKLGIPYDSEEALGLAEELMQFISQRAITASVNLAQKRGSFPNFGLSSWKQKGFDRIRNAALTTVAPTGTIGILAGVSSGIEPLFAISYFRNIMDGTRLVEVNPIFESMAKSEGFYSKDLFAVLATQPSVKEIEAVPERFRRLFVTAFDIAPEWHVRMQAAFQKHTDSGVSKTINLGETSGVDDVKRAYLLAHKLRCKGITIYRYGSVVGQTLNIGCKFERQEAGEGPDAETSAAGRVIEVGSEFVYGCRTC